MDENMQVALVLGVLVIAVGQILGLAVIFSSGWRRRRRQRDRRAQDSQWAMTVVPAKDLATFCQDHETPRHPELIEGLEPPSYVVRWRKQSDDNGED